MGILRKHYAPRGYSVPAFPLRKWVLRLVCMLPLPAQDTKSARFMLRQWGRPHAMGRYDATKVTRQLGVAYTPLEASLVDSVEALIKFGRLPPPRASWLVWVLVVLVALLALAVALLAR